MTKSILLCTDLDRTLLPNGDAPESPQARPLFHQLCQHPELILVYVSGRDKTLLQQAIDDYALPMPDYAIGDVGSSLFHIKEGDWQLDEGWSATLAAEWHGYHHNDIAKLLEEISALRLQEATKQNSYKLSYYLSLELDHASVIEAIQKQLDKHAINNNIIYSIDEPRQLGLIDILPRAADKLQAIHFLQQQLEISQARTVFSGDSGNDLSVLCSSIPATLVANASETVRQQAIAMATAAGQRQNLYLAKGNFLELNGNYSGGIIEGACHYFPQLLAWLQSP